MGRRPDPIELQDAKGAPGKRLSKAQRQLVEAERLASELAAAPADAADPLAPPRFLDARAAPALQVWREHAPRLQSIHLLDQLFRHTFAMFCVYVAEFYQAHEHVVEHGHTQRVKTISGSWQWKRNPMVDVRNEASAKVLEFSKRFGLSPMDQAAIFKDNAAVAAAAQQGGLFPSARRGEDALPAHEEADPVGEMGRFKGPPPGLRPN